MRGTRAKRPEFLPLACGGAPFAAGRRSASKRVMSARLHSFVALALLPGAPSLVGRAGADRFVAGSGDTGSKLVRDLDAGAEDVLVLRIDDGNTRWVSSADVMASGETFGTGSYFYDLGGGLFVETMNTSP